MNARITDEMVETMKAVADDLGFAEWVDPEDAQDILISIINKHHMKLRSLLAAALSQPEAEGMVLVPREPTRQQIDACLEAAACGNLSGLGWAELYRNVYRTMLAATPLTVEEDNCPVCLVTFKPDDICSTDIELGICHAECLKDSPTVDLDTGEPIDGPISTYRYNENSHD